MATASSNLPPSDAEGFIRITFRPSDDFYWNRLRANAGSSTNDLASDFWGALPPPARGGESLRPEEGEKRLLEDFGGAFSKRVRKALAMADVSTEERSFSFRVEKLSYGSLNLLVGFIGIRTLASIFVDIGPEVMLAILSTCAEEAFEDVIGVRPDGARARPGSALSAASALPNSNKPKELELQKKHGWVDVASKAYRIPWLLPLLLALAVIWVAFSGLNEESKRLGEKDSRLAQGQANLLELYSKQTDRLETLLVEVVTARRTPSATPDVPGTNCPCCCPAARPIYPPAPSPCGPNPAPHLPLACRK